MTEHASSGLVCCTLGGQQYGLPGAGVRLVARADQLLPDGGSKGRVGVVRHGGAAVPVYSLAALLGRKSTASPFGGHIVVTSGIDGLYGLLADRVVRLGGNERVDVFPLPAFVGAPASRWFDGLLHGAHLECLLLSSVGFEPGAAHQAAPRTAAARQRRDGAGAEAQEKVIVFRTDALPACAADRFALSARQIAAVVQPLPAIPLPGAAPFVTGLSWWQDTAVPLVDFSTSVRTAPPSRHLLMRTRAGACVGLPVEGDLALHRATADDRWVGRGDAPFVSGVFAVGGDRVALIDVDALVAADLREPVAAYV